ncbi:MAG: DUF393 domain-containing protein [Elusimicrobia bacterium]|nr:DUF393 domain-containing protein [Elusimicrobiota bacterium]
MRNTLLKLKERSSKIENKILYFWNRAFLEERPSIGFSFFRLAVAFTVGAHIIPTLFQIQDNYLSWAFKEKNSAFFTMGILEWVAKSPDWLVWFMVGWFVLFWFLFFIGFRSQVSCILMTAGCYYFYALNSMHIGTLSYDILLVTLFLMCITPYHGDYFSVDSIFRGDPEAYKRKRPFFLQRLLQLQIANTFFYTAFYKITAEGNWITGNPYYYLVNSTAESVVKHFPGRLFLAGHPDLCYWLGISCVCFEVLLSILVFIPRLRWVTIPSVILFHLMLVFTLHVPTIFLFLFPAQFLLFINPTPILEWIEKKRSRNQGEPCGLLLYDGQCGFCRASLDEIRCLDLFGVLNARDLHLVENPKELHPDLTKETCLARLNYLEGGKLFAGFYAFRRIALRLPLLWWLVPGLYVPGMGWLGQKAYDWIARHRHRLFFASAEKSSPKF